MKQYFTELEAAEAAGVSLETIKEFISLGVLKLSPPTDQINTSYLTRFELMSAFHTLKDIKIEEQTAQAEKMSEQKIEAEFQEQVPPEIEADPIQPSMRQEAPQGNTFIEHRSFELLDLNRSLKEQIEMLKGERDWLRKRVETLEVRSERDQLLLLSETKTVQQLLPLKPTEKKGFWAIAIPWLTGK
jgi:DNA-binding transcriptional MerR regulator